MLKSFLRFSALLLVVSLIIPHSYGQKLSDKEEIQKLLAAMQIIDLAYVDSVDMNKVVSDAIIESLKELDPHSAYISKDDLEKANEPLEGSFEGIGVTFQLFQDTILVISPVPGGPSERLGILSGDKIVKINGEDATGSKITNQWVMDKLRGKKGTSVDVSIFRPGKKELLDFTIVRDKIPLNSIDASFMAAPDIGYIRLNRFSRTSIDEFSSSVDHLKQQGMDKLILDLRGNSGGYLNVAVELADEFLSSGNLIVYTEGLHSPRQDFYATPLGDFEKGKLIIIIDEASASASEIVSGAIQDLDRGLVIGRRSFGKGLVQRPFNLPDGSVIRLTTARYYTPSGRCIQRPYSEGTEEYYKDFMNRFKNGELETVDSIHLPDSLKYHTANGRVVYGGGGIMPDVFIPWDSTMFSDYYVDLRRKGLLNSYTLKYVEDNRAAITRNYPTLDIFKDNFQISDDMIKAFQEKAEQEGVKFDEKGWNDAEKLIVTSMKALIARNLWNINAFYVIMSDIDTEYHKAIKLLDNPQSYNKFIGD